MKIREIIIVVLVCFVTIMLWLHYMHANSDETPSSLVGSNPTESQATQQNLLHALLRDQNDTIHSLNSLLRASHPSTSNMGKDTNNLLLEIDNLRKQLHSKDLQIQAQALNVHNHVNSDVNTLTKAQCDAKVRDTETQMKATMCKGSNHNRYSNSNANVNSNNMNFIGDSIQSSMEEDCDNRYGIGLLNNWKATKQEWCSSKTSTSGIKSSLNCYPHQQLHKKRDGRGPDLICEGTNLLLDFTKISGAVSTSGKPAKGNQYLSFQRDNIVGFCEKTSAFREALFMPHQKLQMSGFTTRSSDSMAYNAKREDTTTYLLARDEDCENTFHSTADFMNMYFVLSMLGISPSELQVMLWDKFSNGPYFELLQKAYSPNHPVLRHTAYSGQVLFKRIIFHLESPAGLIFPKVSNPPGVLRCKSPALFNSYRKFVLEAFDLYNQNPPPIPTVTVSLRRRTSTKNVGRVMQNEQEVESILKLGTMMHYKMVDFGGMAFSEQLKIIRSTNILVGVHGAGLMYIMFAADESILIEVHPSYRLDRHFRHAARMTGKIYMPIRSQKRETCVGSSDNVVVPIDEFRNTLDGAVRIARSFDDGLAECGLVCPSSILALDKGLDMYYGSASHATKGSPQNTRFPC